MESCSNVAVLGMSLVGVVCGVILVVALYQVGALDRWLTKDKRKRQKPPKNPDKNREDPEKLLKMTSDNVE